MAISYKPLWRLLVDKEMIKEDLRTEVGLARTTIAKMGKDQYVALEVIDRICTHFGVQPNDVIEHVPDESLRKL
ncbi:hypothetical protein J6TS7_53430 [Paenibacillus dendritiformis]|uniref:helix-turn-helix domain-containing protein n=1 Tax=Paenibacillus TaxID=44249 RepID=UPI001B10A38A|nr:helix-turn-helix transcriptional regulator [Paenibacillus dendritiformis]GIO81733.1 hypothetical protein J6TS7_53430 [Paenibacillus dendritiformis]